MLYVLQTSTKYFKLQTNYTSSYSSTPGLGLGTCTVAELTQVILFLFLFFLFVLNDSSSATVVFVVVDSQKRTVTVSQKEQSQFLYQVTCCAFLLPVTCIYINYLPEGSFFLDFIYFSALIIEVLT